MNVVVHRRKLLLPNLDLSKAEDRQRLDDYLSRLILELRAFRAQLHEAR